MEVKKKAYAKINLTLDLTGILPDGYHGIFTCMQSAGVFDMVNVRKIKSGIKLSCSEKYIPCNEKNTAFLAAKYFFEESGKEGGAEIYIKKVIPSGAGLAGGSADAAAVLLALNEMYGLVLSEKELLSVAKRIGADVPFCVLGGTRLCQNIGEIMSPLPDFKGDIVIAKPFERVSTKDAYARFDSASDVPHPDNDSFLFYAASGDYRKAVEYSSNIFEFLSDVKSGESIKNTMKECGAYFSAMSGSGSAYFGLFPGREEAEKCAEKLKGSCEKVFVTETKTAGVE